MYLLYIIYLFHIPIRGLTDPWIWWKPLPQPVETRTCRCRYGFAWVRVQVALGNPRVTRDNLYGSPPSVPTTLLQPLLTVTSEDRHVNPCPISPTTSQMHMVLTAPSTHPTTIPDGWELYNNATRDMTRGNSLFTLMRQVFTLSLYPVCFDAMRGGIPCHVITLSNVTRSFPPHLVRYFVNLHVFSRNSI